MVDRDILIIGAGALLLAGGFAGFKLFKGAKSVFGSADPVASGPTQAFSDPNGLINSATRKGWNAWHSGNRTYVQCGNTTYSVLDSDLERTAYIKRRMVFSNNCSWVFG